MNIAGTMNAALPMSSAESMSSVAAMAQEQPMSSAEPKSTTFAVDGWKRRLYVSLGVTSVAFGVVGAFVPGLPTTVFLIIASWFFTRSSPRLQARLLSHPRFGTPLRRFLEHRTMPRKAKVTALGSMWGGAGVSCAGAVGGGLPMLLPLLVVCAALIGTLWIGKWS